MAQRIPSRKLKRQPTKWEKIFASRIYKEHLQLNNKKINVLMKNDEYINEFYSM